MGQDQIKQRVLGTQSKLYKVLTATTYRQCLTTLNALKIPCCTPHSKVLNCSHWLRALSISGFAWVVFYYDQWKPTILQIPNLNFYPKPDSSQCSVPFDFESKPHRWEIQALSNSMPQKFENTAIFLITFRLNSKTQWQMFLLLYACHVCVPPRGTSMVSPYKAV